MASSAFAAALVLAGVFAAARSLGAAELPHRRRWISAASGASVAYVFADLLPEMATRQRAFLEAAGGGLLFAEQRIYVLALAGFVVSYGLEHMVLTSSARGRTDAGDGGDPVYWLHVGGFAAYSAVIGYLLVERAKYGALALVLYTAAMAFHFAVVDRSLRHEHGHAYDQRGRWALATSVLVGCLLGMVTRLSDLSVARIFAFVAGGVVITSATAELPARDGRFWAFCLGAGVYTVLLLLAGWKSA